MLCVITLFFVLFIRAVSSQFQASYMQWQCEPPEQRNISSMSIVQFRQVYDVIGYPDWLKQQRKSVSCNQKGLTTVPGFLDADIEILDLCQNLIRHVRKDDFARYKSLVALLFCNNCVFFNLYYSTIPRCVENWVVEKGSFAHLTNLKYLNIAGNTLKKLPGELPVSLEALYSSFGSLGPIHEDELNYLTSLRVGLFSFNCLVKDRKDLCKGNFTIRGNPFASTKLEYLDIGYNNWTQVPKHLLVPSLKGFRIQGNPLLSLQKEDFSKIPEVTYLIISWASQYFQTPLVLKEDALSNLTKLEHLDLSGNMIRSLPENFLKSSTKLRYLDLSFNCIYSIDVNPFQLPYLPNLETLDLSGNTFCTRKVTPIKPVLQKLVLEKSFLKFPNLQYLALGAHKISRIFYIYLSYGRNYITVDSNSFRVLKQLPNFSQLALAGCGIRNLNTSAWAGLNLTYIDLRVNNIGESPESPVHHNRYAKGFGEHLSHVIQKEYDVMTSQRSEANAVTTNMLTLRRNAIRDTKRYQFKYTPLITHLDLSHNQINYIYNDTFRPLTLLQFVDLRYNPIRRIHEGAFTGLFHLSSFLLNLTAFEEELTFDFLSSAETELCFQIGGFDFQIYRTLRLCRSENQTFPKVVNLDLSGNAIPIFEISTNVDIFKPFPNVISLDLKRSNMNFILGSRFFLGVPKVEKLILAYCWLQEFPYLALQKVCNLTFLDLSYNQISYIDMKLFPKLPHLKILNISHNYLCYPPPELFGGFKTVQLVNIDLSYNLIEDVGPTIINNRALKKLNYLNLQGNQIKCDCSLSENFGLFVRTESRVNKSLPGFLPTCSYEIETYYGGCIECQAPVSVKTASFFTYSTSCACQVELALALAVSYTACFSLFIVVAMIFSQKCWKVKLAKFVLSDIRQQSIQESENSCEENQIFAFHGFVFYDRDDASTGDWVDHRMLPEMERGNPAFRLSVVGREDFCGTTQVNQLLLRMEASRKTLVILTSKFLKTPQCRYVLSVLEDWLYEKGNDKCVIVTFANDPQNGPLFRRRQRLNPHSILHYRHTCGKGDLIFWESLRAALIINKTNLFHNQRRTNLGVCSV